LIGLDLDCELTPELIRGGYAREMVNRIQRARKDQGFDVSDRIEVVFSAQGELDVAADEHRDYIMGEVLAVAFVGNMDRHATQTQIDGQDFAFTLSKAGA